MQGLSRLERAVVRKLLAGDHPVLAALRRQANSSRLTRRQKTGVGFFCDFQIQDEAPAVDQDFELGDLHAEVEGLEHGAGFVLFVRGGRLTLLEGFSYDEPWPDEIRSFSLRYLDPDRKAALAKLG